MSTFFDSGWIKDPVEKIAYLFFWTASTYLEKVSVISSKVNNITID
jgi:hypothetical protein